MGPQRSTTLGRTRSWRCGDGMGCLVTSRPSPAVVPCLVACAACLHGAPTTTSILGRVVEHPPAVLTCLKSLPRAVVLRCEQRRDDLGEHVVGTDRVCRQHDTVVDDRCCQSEPAEDALQGLERTFKDGSQQRLAPLSELFELPRADRVDREAFPDQPVAKLIRRSPCIGTMFTIDAVAEPTDDFQGTSRSVMIRPAAIGQWQACCIGGVAVHRPRST